MEERIRKLLKRLEQVEELLGQADILSDQKQFRSLAQEHSYLSEIKEGWLEYQRFQTQLEENQGLIRDEVPGCLHH